MAGTRSLSRVAGMNHSLQGLAAIVASPLGAFLMQVIPIQTILLIVCHGGTVVQIVSWWLRLPIETLNWVNFHSHPTGVTVLTETKWGRGGWSVSTTAPTSGIWVGPSRYPLSRWRRP